jgi:ubiquitin-protein ligase
MSVRLKRLFSDYQILSEALLNHPNISVLNTFNDPPDKYHIEYRVNGLVLLNGTVQQINRHEVEIVLPLGYPHDMPVCRMRTPVFHPNIAPHSICIADYWVASESLLQLVIRIGEMICFQSYNIKSPLDGEAAKWTEEHLAELPIDRSNLQPVVDVHSIEIKEQPAPSTVNEIVKDIIEKSHCQNCKKEIDFFSERKCKNGHSVCDDCIIECASCKEAVCLICGVQKCRVCGKFVCSDCDTQCGVCKSHVCKEHRVTCVTCGEQICPRCLAKLPSTENDSNENYCVKCKPVSKSTVAGDIGDSGAANVKKLFCPECGTKNEEYARFCTKCGTRIQ